MYVCMYVCVYLNPKQGTGFSTNTGGTGNIIRIGKYICDPIPLHCTVTHIACKTRTALEGQFASSRDNARTRVCVSECGEGGMQQCM